MRLIIMFVAIALAAGAFFITMHFTAAPPRDPQLPVVSPQVQVKEAPTVDVYTAKQDIPIGTIVKQELLDLQPWPKNLVLPDMVVAEAPHPGDIVKMITRTPFSKGEPIMLNKLANENDPSFLAASLAEGMRLITVAVDVVSGVGGFIFPGDHVDILLTHEVPLETVFQDSVNTETASDTSVYRSVPSGAQNNAVRSTGQGVSNVLTTASSAQGQVTGSRNTFAVNVASKPATIKKQVTEILVRNARVLAINQKSTSHGGDAPAVPTNISIELSPEDAQKVRLSENGNGRISLALRSLKEKEAPLPTVMPSVVPDLSSYKETSDVGVSQITIVRGIHAESVEVSKP